MKKILQILFITTYLLYAGTSVTVVGSQTTVQQTVTYISPSTNNTNTSTSSSNNTYHRNYRYTSTRTHRYMPSPIKITIVYYSIFSEEDSKDGKRMRFNIAFSKPVKKDITLKYEIVPQDITLGQDILQSQYGSINVKKGSKSADIYLDVVDDSIKEDTEKFLLKIKKPAGNFKLDNSTCQGMIIDNDQDKKPSSASGDYIINGGNPIDTQIASTQTLALSVQGKPGFEVVTYDGYKTSKSCSSPSCKVVDDKKICTSQCTTTTYHVVETSEKMTVDTIILHRFKEYDPVSKECSLESSVILNDNTSKSGYKSNTNRYAYGKQNRYRKRNRYQKQNMNQNMNMGSNQSSNNMNNTRTRSRNCHRKNRGSSYLNENSSTKYLSLDSGESMTVYVPLDTAYRCVYVEVLGHSDKDKDGNIQQLKGVSDTFAIRPKSFHINAKDLITSGKNFDFNINASGVDFNTTAGYSQMQTKTFDIDVKDKIYSTNDLKIYDVIFYDGLSELKVLNYDEVGVLDIKVSEKPTNYYAIVDESNSYIEPDTKTITFIPEKFSLDYSIGYQNGASFAMFSNNVDEMNSRLRLDIKALNAKGAVTKRFTKNGYADDCNLTFEQSINKSAGQKVYYKYATDEKNAVLSDVKQSLSFILPKKDFINGELIGDIKESFARVKNMPQNPIELTTYKLDIVDTNYTSVTGLNNNQKKSYHYYARAHVAPDPFIVKGTYMSANVFYEIYCKSCDKSKFLLANNRSSIDSVYWYILPASIYLSKGICDIKTAIDSINHDGNILSKERVNPNQIDIKIKNAPYENKIIYTPKFDYLLFDRVNPSVVNHKFIVKFTSANSIWAGEGNLGNTVDTNISKNANMGIDW